MTAKTGLYAARLDVDYPEKLDRVTTAFRIIWIIPIAIVLSVLSAYRRLDDHRGHRVR